MIRVEDRVHPFSGAVKAEQQHPQFSLESRTKKRTNSLETLIFPTFTPPDEEKGRKFRATATAPSLFFNSKALSYGNTATLESENNDEFEDEWFKDRGSSKGLTSKALAPAWHFENAEVKKDWRSAITGAFHDPAGSNGNIELSSVGLSEIPDEVRELSLLTNINNAFPSPKSLISNGRTASGPLMFNNGRSPGSPLSPRRFIRSSSGPLSSSVHVDFFLSNNKIISENISHALWSVKSTRVLSLRSNCLNYIPEGIGRLENLTTLNIAANQITFLPSEILLLNNLSQIHLNPNPFLSPPPISSSPSPSHLISPLVIHFKIPSLQELSIRALLSLKSAFIKPSPFPAHLLSPFLTTFDSLPARSSTSSSNFNNAQPFDPLSNICRSPYHPEEEIYYYKPAVERMEWIKATDLTSNTRKEMSSTTNSPEVVVVEDLERSYKAKVVPIRHRGCGIHCLDWLEQ